MSNSLEQLKATGTVSNTPPNALAGSDELNNLFWALPDPIRPHRHYKIYSILTTTSDRRLRLW